MQLPVWFEQPDFTIWYHINSLWRSPLLDVVMPYLRNQFFWAPLYLFLLVFVLYNFGIKGLAWCAGFLLCFALGDFISASLIKPFVQRMRPCNDPRLAAYAQLIVPRSTGYSFPSSHAANHFAMGTFMAITFWKRGKIWAVLSIFWAVLVSYAQVYTGVHFPFDVLAGGLLGAGIGVFVAWLYHKRFTLGARLQPAAPPVTEEAAMHK